MQQDTSGTGVQPGEVQPEFDWRTVEGPIWLDLGAAGKKEQGWITVDLATQRDNLWKHKDKTPVLHFVPDVIADITALPFPDDWCDRARAVHVIEHFYAWEAGPVLREWLRVLKPGGDLALELPCLEKVFALAAVPQCPPDFVHWALYGDPRYKDPAMCHKWGYTTQQMIKTMLQCGFVDVHAEPPKFHFAVRDMRVVGRKPVPEPRVVLPGA